MKAETKPEMFALLACKGRQLQPGDPALGALLQRLHVLGGKIERHHICEEGAGFFRREAQVSGAQLGHLASGTQPRKRKGGVGAAGDHQVHLRRHMF